MFRLFARPSSSFSSTLQPLRALSTSTPCLLKSMPPRPPPLPEDSFTEAFLCGTGPGGQKINKTSSAVQLKHLATGIVLKVQATRSRTQNRKIAREMLALRVQDLECREKQKEAERESERQLERAAEKAAAEGVELDVRKKKPVKVEKSRLQVVSETKIKRKMSGAKKTKRKYKRLDEEKARARKEAEAAAAST